MGNVLEAKKIYLMESFLHRNEFTVSSIGTALTRIYLVDAKEFQSGFEARKFSLSVKKHFYRATQCLLSWDSHASVKTVGTIALCLIKVPLATMKHEKRYHNYIQILHFYDKELGQHRYYKKPSTFESFLQFLCHFFRLGKH